MNITTLLNRPKAIIVSLALSLALFSASCGSGSSFNLKIPGVQGPTVTLIEDKVLISMIFENLRLDGGLRYSIPQYPNSYMEISPDLQSGGTLLAAYVSLTDLFQGNLQLLPPQYLPGGRPLPGVATGRLPAVAFSIVNFYGITFYVGNNVFGMFVPFKLDIGSAIVTARFYVGSTRTGNISLVGPDANGENSGLLLLLDLSSTQLKQLKSYAAKNAK